MAEAQKFEFVPIRLLKPIVRELTDRLTPEIRARLNAELPRGKFLDDSFAIGFLSEYVLLSRDVTQSDSRGVRKWLQHAEQALKKIQDECAAVNRSVQSLRRERPSSFEKAFFDPAKDLPLDFLELDKVFADISRACEFAIAHIPHLPKRRGPPVDILQRLFLRQSGRCWIYSVGSPPGISRNGKFSNFLLAVEELLPEDCRPRPISEETLKVALRVLKDEFPGIISKKMS